MVAEQLGHPKGGTREAGDPLAALYLAVHHLYLALERLAADEPTGA